MLRLPGIAGRTEPLRLSKQKTRQMHDPGKLHALSPLGMPRRGHEADIVRLDEIRRSRPLARPALAPARPPLAWYDRIE